MGKNIVKELTKANIKAYGIERAPQYDFKDDGKSFRGFIYKGMPMTQCYEKNYGEVHLYIRYNYLKNNFTWNEWKDTEESDLCGEFNGSYEIDMDKLIENLERVIAKVNELNSNTEISAETLNKLKVQAEKEVKPLEVLIERVQNEVKWWKLETYELSNLRRYMNCLSRDIDNYYSIISGVKNLPIVTIKKKIELMNSEETLFNSKYVVEALNKALEG